ncbi:MAG TPA: hypothetical protein VNK24_01625 [Elusimicrobiota bacterium]|nr:hypothetical protein [Elusimicrobiota bacterium]
MKKTALGALVLGAVLMAGRVRARGAAAAPALDYAGPILALLENPLGGSIGVGYAVAPSRQGRILGAGGAAYGASDPQDWGAADQSGVG